MGFLGYPQPGGGTHPPIPGEGVLGKVLGDWANLALSQAHKNTRSRVVRATAVANLSSDKLPCPADPLTEGGLLLSRQQGARWGNVACGWPVEAIM